MKAHYHRQIARQALEEDFSRRALAAILEASLGQDDLAGQLFHPEYHFDESLEEGWTYLNVQRELGWSALRRGDNPSAWQAFGRLIHAAQDFYAHSNYVALWASHNSQGNRVILPQERELPVDLPPASAIQSLDPRILEDPGLRTDHIYFPWDGLNVFPFLGPILKRVMPLDSHARMNLDSPESGPLFQYALNAAVLRTRREFDDFTDVLEPAVIKQFTDRRDAVDKIPVDEAGIILSS